MHSARVVGMCILLALACLALAGMAANPHFIRPEHADFQQDYVLARALLARVDPYQPVDQLTSQFAGFANAEIFPFPSPHPPTDALLFLPTALVDYRTALLVWLGINALLIVAALRLLTDLADGRLSFVITVFAAAALTLWRPLASELDLGQINLAMLVTLLLALRALRSNQPGRAGAWVGLAVALKPTAYLIILLLLLRREYRSAAWGVAVAGGLLALATVLMGVGAVLRYATVVLPEVNRVFIAWPINLSLWSIGWRVLAGTGGVGVTDLGSSPPIVALPSVAPYAAPVIPLALLFWSLWQARRIPDVEHAFSLMVAVIPLVSPLAWIQDFLLVTPALAIAVRWALAGQRSRWQTAALALIAVGTELSPLSIPVLAVVALVLILPSLGSTIDRHCSAELFVHPIGARSPRVQSRFAGTAKQGAAQRGADKPEGLPKDSMNCLAANRLAAIADGPTGSRDTHSDP